MRPPPVLAENKASLSPSCRLKAAINVSTLTLFSLNCPVALRFVLYLLIVRPDGTSPAKFRINLGFALRDG